MMEHAVYAVISPEGCASILWRDPAQAGLAADALKLTAADLKSLHLVDDIVAEPLGGAHRAAAEAMTAVGTSIAAALQPLLGLGPDALKAQRRDKFLAMGREGIA
jgi:acetyl-CoA carboxylase carboxyl transferase subunit alpha